MSDVTAKLDALEAKQDAQMTLACTLPIALYDTDVRGDMTAADARALIAIARAAVDLTESVTVGNEWNYDLPEWLLAELNVVDAALEALP